jgi:hypothetical protein
MSDSATKDDIVELRAELKADSAELRAELKADSAELRAELKESFSDITALLQTFMQQVDERFIRVELEQKKMREEISRVFDFLDSVMKKQEISDDERLVMGHQLDRLDKWTHELANRIGYTLET